MPENLSGQRWATRSSPGKSANGKTKSKRQAAEATRRKAEAEQQRLADEETARRKTEEAEQQRLAAAETARREAEEAEQQRLDDEETARREAEAEQQRQAAAETARGKAEEAEQQRLADEETARREAEEAEQQRQAAAETARREAEEAEQQRLADEETARRKAEEAEQQRLADEETARRKAAEAEQQRLAAAETARREAEAEQQRQAAAETARRKAEEAEQQRLADAETARREAEEAEQQRQAAAETARREAEAEQQRQAAAETARREAEEAEQQRLADEETARREAEEAEQQRLADEETARRKAEEAEQQRLADEETARRKAEEAEQQRLADEETARRKAEEAEQQRLADEETARRKAEEAEQQRLADEETARREAEAEQQRQAAAETARRKAEEAEQQRLADEETARREAEEAEQQRLADEETARREAEEAEQQRLADEETARREAEEAEQQRLADEETARREAEEAEQQRLADEETARREAEEAEQQRLADKETARREAEEAEQQRLDDEETTRREAEKQRKVGQLAEREIESHRRQRAANASAKTTKQAAPAEVQAEQASSRTTVKLAQQLTLKPVQARIKTKLEVPGRKKTQQDGILHERRKRRRQPGEPNLYKLHPFRVTPLIRNRAQVSGKKSRQGFILVGLALLGLLALAVSYLTMPAALVLKGPEAMAALPGSGPILLAGDRLLLHDRSGAGSAELELQSLGLNSLIPPMAVSPDGELIARGVSPDSLQHQNPPLMRCDLKQVQCQVFSDHLADRALPAFAVHPLHGSIFLVDADSAELLKLNSEGELLARAPVDAQGNPVIRLESGLLFMNSPVAPAIGVYRPDDDGFGRQLDEILLLPPEAVAAQQDRVTNFTWSGEYWWVALQNPDTGDTGLYRFDLRWNYIARVTLPPGAKPELLLNWGEKTLVADSRQLAIERFNTLGEAEVPLVSNLLTSLVSQQKKREGLAQLTWIAGLIICLVSAVTGLYLGILHRQRWLVYKPGGERGAEPIDALLASTQWLTTFKKRSGQLRRTTFSYGLLAIALMLFAISKNVTVLQLLALLIALLGPLITLILLSRTTAGNIGVAGKQLLLADHTDMYHIGSGPGIKYRGPFLLIDDVVVFTGTALLPAFAREQVVTLVSPEATRGIRVDRRTVAIKLLESHHPLAVGAISSAICLAAAAVLLCLEFAG